jgi:secreted trypsin-like serine protease
MPKTTKTTITSLSPQADECGCSVINVVLSHDNQQLSSTNGTNENAYLYSWSMVVSIRVNSTKHTSTGTILSNSFILTTAHCVSNQSKNTRIIIAAGIHSLSQYITSIRRLDHVYIHENYTNKTPHLYDIAILHLEQPLELKSQPIFSKICLSNIKSFDSMGVSYLFSVGWKHSNAVENEDNTL